MDARDVQEEGLGQFVPGLAPPALEARAPPDEGHGLGAVRLIGGLYLRIHHVQGYRQRVVAPLGQGPRCGLPAFRLVNSKNLPAHG